MSYFTQHIPAYSNLRGAPSIDDFQCVSRDELTGNLPQYISDDFAPSDFRADLNFFGTGVSVPRDPVGVYSSTLGNIERIFRTYRSALDVPAVGSQLFTWVETGAGNDLEGCVHVQLNFGRVSRLLLGPDDDANEQLVRQLVELDPQVVAGSMQSLMHLESICRQAEHSVGAQLILCAGGLLGSDEIEGLQNTFGAPVVHAYAVPEAGLIALECVESGNLHVMMDANYVEVAVQNGDVVPEGYGELVLTNLDNQALGLVRYRTEDVAELRQFECSCGYYGPTVCGWRHENFSACRSQMINE